MNKLYIILILFLMYSFSSTAQGIKVEKAKPITEFINKLKSNHIDTIIIYTQYCNGCEIVGRETNELSDEKDNDGLISKYVIWFSEGKFLAKTFNEPTTIFIVEFDEVLIYVTEHIDQINSIFEYVKKHKFLPPNPVHDSFESLQIEAGAFKIEFHLSETQKKEKFWESFLWIPPRRETMSLTRKALSLN